MSDDQSISFSLNGVIGSELRVVELSTLQLATTIAHDNDGNSFVVPLADWQMVGRSIKSTEDSADVNFEGLLPLDNIAYLINDMCEEFENLLQQFEHYAVPSALNAQQVAEWMKQAALNAQAAAKIAERLSSSTAK
ncbi:hypothetical protein [Pseudophaeobacter sp.]|uniref:hypothetical protein n=1 Tax=Pseudophaeobacter sp. TaxID=1971739 RepID=UPI004059721B